MEVGGVTLRKEEPLDAKAVGKLNQSRHTFFGSVARHGMKMTVHVPDSEVHSHLHSVPGNTPEERDRKSTRLNSSHGYISYAVFCLKKKKKESNDSSPPSKRLTQLHHDIVIARGHDKDTRLAFDEVYIDDIALSEPTHCRVTSHLA